MYAQKEKKEGNQSRAVSNSVTQKKNYLKQNFGFLDNRLQSIKQRKTIGLGQKFTNQIHTTSEGATAIVNSKAIQMVSVPDAANSYIANDEDVDETYIKSLGNVMKQKNTWWDFTKGGITYAPFGEYDRDELEDVISELEAEGKQDTASVVEGIRDGSKDVHGALSSGHHRWLAAIKVGKQAEVNPDAKGEMTINNLKAMSAWGDVSSGEREGWQEDLKEMKKMAKRKQQQAKEEKEISNHKPKKQKREEQQEQQD